MRTTVLLIALLAFAVVGVPAAEASPPTCQVPDRYDHALVGYVLCGARTAAQSAEDALP